MRKADALDQFRDRLQYEQPKPTGTIRRVGQIRPPALFDISPDLKVLME